MLKFTVWYIEPDHPDDPIEEEVEGWSSEDAALRWAQAEDSRFGGEYAIAAGEAITIHLRDHMTGEVVAVRVSGSIRYQTVPARVGEQADGLTPAERCAAS